MSEPGIIWPDEIVPLLLHKRLRWDWRHDAMAEKITPEFNLKLPRDRELIRQLAFVSVQQEDKPCGGGTV
jgi:hypothetical protein